MLACSVVWQCQGKQDLPSILAGGWERSQKVVAWSGVTQNCKAECSVCPSNDGSRHTQAYSPAGVSLWQWEEVGLEPVWTCEGKRFTGNIFQMPACDAGTRAPLCTQCLVRFSGPKLSLKRSLDLSQSQFIPCACCCVSRLL